MSRTIDSSNIILPPECRCENCAYWQEWEPDELGGHKGECVCLPPVFVGLDSEGLARFEQPVTGVNSTCGSWQEFRAYTGTDGRTREGSYRWIEPAKGIEELLGAEREKGDGERVPKTTCEDAF